MMEAAENQEQDQCYEVVPLKDPNCSAKSHAGHAKKDSCQQQLLENTIQRQGNEIVSVKSRRILF